MKTRGIPFLYSSSATFLLLLFLAACSTTSTAPEQAQETTYTLEEVANLTAEQIAQLDESQLEAVEQTVQLEVDAGEKLLASVSSELNPAATGGTTGSSPTPQRWPNYLLTRYYAININATNYLKNVRFSYTGPKWVSDGCTGVPEAPSGVSFTAACVQHDFGYGNLPQYTRGRSELNRQLVDARFYFNMIAACSAATSSLRNRCNTYAFVYYAGVRTYGQPRYLNTPAKFY
jgi:hypothetical protein